MKKFNLFLVLICSLIFDTGVAQVPKVAFVGATRTGSNDGFSFVAGENLPGGTVIYFTDEEYRDACNEFHFDNSCSNVTDGQPYLIYTVKAGGLSEGDVVSIVETTDETFTATTMSGSAGSVVEGNSVQSYTLAASDVLYAFDASNPSDALNTVIEIYASIKFAAGVFDGVNNGDNPVGDYPNAIVYIIGADNGEYTPSLRDDAPVNRADLLNSANWTTSSSELTLSTDPFTMGVDLTILPVEFTYFTTQTEREGVMLKWQTATEENNDYFQVEHSTDGRNFAILGQIKGKGTTQDLSDYTFLDEKPALGVNYYRLKQVDYDGAFEYSEIAVTQFGGESTTVTMYPNPIHDQLTLNLSTSSGINDQGTNAVLTIKNLHGQLVRQEVITS